MGTSRGILILLLFVLTSKLAAVVAPAKVYRACLDRPTLTLSVSMSPPSDDCGSFSYHRLYGREDAFSPWKLLGQTATLNTFVINATLPNSKAWEVYVSTSFACNGKDTLVSNHVTVDNQAPAQFEPDSVSIEFSTQRMIAGWKKPLELDILGYSLFKLVSGGNALIKDTFSTFYRFDTSTFNPKKSGNSFCIAAFDSCLNGGLLSNYHSPIKLTVQKDARFWCSKKTLLVWTKYIGWTTAKYTVWRYCVTDGSWSFLGDVPSDLINDPATYGFTDASYQLNKTYLYFVRAHRNGFTTSSSSNTVNIDYASNNNIAPIGLIRGASVVSPDVVKLDFDWKKDGPSSLLTIEKKNGAGWTNIHSTAIGGSNSINDISTKTQLTDAEFRVIRTNDCGVNDDTSYSHKTILLTENQRVMGWTPHLGWSNNAINTDFDYHLEIKSGFTWNELYSGKSLSFALPSNLYGNQTFRVSIFSNDGKLPINYSLYSNEIKVYLGFDASQFDTMLIPSAFNPSGINTVFKISNPAISAGESEMSIFNRWGEMIFNGDALVGWDGRDTSGSEVPQGTYVYLIQASYRNKKTRHSGTLLLIK